MRLKIIREDQILAGIFTFLNIFFLTQKKFYFQKILLAKFENFFLFSGNK
jgi:hypothetical protein